MQSVKNGFNLRLKVKIKRNMNENKELYKEFCGIESVFGTVDFMLDRNA